MSARRLLTLPSTVSEESEESEESGGQLGLPGQATGVVAELTGADVSSVVSVQQLPAPYDVAAEVAGPLSAKERGDLELCEQALHGFRKALIVAGKALEVIKRGRLYRETHATFEDYVMEAWGFKRAHAYRLIDGWPVAAAMSPIGDINEAQARTLLPAWRGHGPDATAVLYREVRELSGGKVTAAALEQAVQVLPKRLAAPEQAADVLRVAAAEGRVPLIVPPRVAARAVVDEPAGDEATDPGVEAMAVLEAALAQQRQIYDRLAGVVPAALAFDPGRAEVLLAELRQYAKRTGYRAKGRSKGGGTPEEDQGED